MSNKRQIASNDTWSIPIEKLMLWRGSWTKYDQKMLNLYLRMVYDQLLITADNKVLESFNMHHKMKGIYKDDVMILIDNSNINGIRKIKFQIKSNLAQCLDRLGSHFPVVPHNGFTAHKGMNSKYRNINEVLKHALDFKGDSAASSLPTDYENFIKLCLLDPGFPQMVSETETILNKEILKK